MMKYTCNNFHALKITFANETARLCAALGVDAFEVMDLVCQDTQLNISRAYLRPGFAFGGSCLPKDLRATTYLAKQRDVSLDASPDGESPAIDRLRDTAASPEEQAMEHAEDEHTHHRIDEAMAHLSQRERWILEHRMLGEAEVTLESLGRELGISKERVRQIEARALQKLRGALSDLAA
jgi:RNA polymerase sigma factor (sigma-70 family)